MRKERRWSISLFLSLSSQKKNIWSIRQDKKKRRSKGQILEIHQIREKKLVVRVIRDIFHSFVILKKTDQISDFCFCPSLERVPRNIRYSSSFFCIRTFFWFMLCDVILNKIESKRRRRRRRNWCRWIRPQRVSYLIRQIKQAIERKKALQNENITDRWSPVRCLFKSVRRIDDGQRSDESSSSCCSVLFCSLLICNRLLTVHLLLLEVIRTIW